MTPHVEKPETTTNENNCTLQASMSANSSRPSSWSQALSRLLVLTWSLGLLSCSTGFVARQPRSRHSQSSSSSSSSLRNWNIRGWTWPVVDVNACPTDVAENSIVLCDAGKGGVDRRQAMLAMVGTSIGVTGSMTFFPDYANAVYGSDAKMLFPDPIQGLSDRAGKQCLVESLGTRECLVYREDEDKLLYKGADVNSLLVRVQEAARALDRDIPPLVESKKWTQLTGVLTGPMGQLSSTMALLEKLAENPSVAKQNAQKVKQDIFAIGTAVTNKQGDVVLKYRSLALEDLAIFLKGL